MDFHLRKCIHTQNGGHFFSTYMCYVIYRPWSNYPMVLKQFWRKDTALKIQTGGEVVDGGGGGGGGGGILRQFRPNAWLVALLWLLQNIYNLRIVCCVSTMPTLNGNVYFVIKLKNDNFFHTKNRKLWIKTSPIVNIFTEWLKHVFALCFRTTDVWM